MVDVVRVAARDDNLAFDGCLTAAAAWREEFVEVQVAVEAKGVVLEEYQVVRVQGFVVAFILSRNT